MTQEEKAKRYDEALERAKKLYEQGTITESLSYVFPELKENEDEKIRENIIATIHLYYGEPLEDEAKEMIAWLEKQGEQDPCDNCKDVMLNCHNFPCTKKKAFKQGKSVLEVIKEDGEIITYSETDGYKLVGPKFKKDDWVVNKFGDVWHIDSFDKKNYQVSDGKGNYNYFPVSRQDKMHHWTIQDAKDGDVLVIQETDFTYESIFIFNKIENNHIIQYLHYFITDTDEEVCKVKSVGGFLGDVGDNVHPATKEQREQLEKAMTDAGYAFDFEKKELKKIEQNPAVWSKIDDANLEGSIYFIKEFRRSTLCDTESRLQNSRTCIEWLASLKDRVQPQSKQEWSEEDEKTLNNILSCIEYCQDEALEARYNGDRNVDTKRYEQMSDWLKSIRPQSTWKPSDEQIKAFEHFVRSIGESGYTSPYENNTKLLYSLLEDLRKLK